MLAHSLKLVFPRITAPASRSFLSHKSILGRHGPHQRQRAGRGLHPVARRDIVFDQNRNPVQRTARSLRAPLTIQRVGNGQGVGI